MVEQITAFKSSDGKLHDTESKAATHECRVRLEKLVKNPGLITEVINNARGVYDALGIMLDASKDKASPGIVHMRQGDDSISVCSQ